MGGSRRSVAEGDTAAATTPRDRKRLASSVPSSLYHLFSDSLNDTIVDVYLNSHVSRRQGITRDRLLEVAKLPVPEYFHSYLCCSICYENALLSAVGDCSHLVCFLCMMRLKIFYENVRELYMCPYCKQESSFLFVCANPFFAHRSVDPALYNHEGYPELTQTGLKDMLSIMRFDASVDLTLQSQNEVNIKDIQTVFFKSTRDLKNNLCRPSEQRMQRLTDKMKGLTVDQQPPRDVFQDVYTKKHRPPRLDGGYVIVGEYRLVFEHTGMYLLFRAVTSALCWMPECRSSWYPSEPIDTPERLKQTIEKINRIRSKSYKALNNHVKGRHGVAFCEVCQNHFREKQFICEMALYMPHDIAGHMKLGDIDRIPPIPAHVLCTACRRFQWDHAELKKHAKEQHFFCDICDSEGWAWDVFADYPSIFSHFKTYHYPCEEEDCMFVVFKDDLQLQLHYMSKHPTRPRIQSLRKYKPQPPVQPLETPRCGGSVSYDRDQQFSTKNVQWNGMIRIILDTFLEKVDIETKETKETVSAEFEEWLSRRPYLTNPELQRLSKMQDLLEAFAKDMIHVNFGSGKHIFDFDTFNVKCSTRVISDLNQVFEIFKAGSFPPRCVLWDKLLPDFKNRSMQILSQLEREYKIFLDASLIEDTERFDELPPEERPKNLLDIVKKSMSAMVSLIYNINLHAEFESLLGYVKGPSVQLKASPNALLLLDMLGDMINATNKILVKQSLDWIIKELETAVQKASETKQTNTSLSALVNGKSKAKGELHLDMLNPGSDLVKGIYQDKQVKRMQNVTKRQGKTAWGATNKQVKPPSAPVFDKEPPAQPDPPEQPSEEQSEKQESAELQNERYIASVEEGFKKNMNTNFYVAMANVIRNALICNEAKYNASAPGYRLRETTKMKINQLLTSGNRRFTTLSEFVSMQLLESLQALEPEYHRLIKEGRRTGEIDALAKTWSSRCAYALRRCRVEQLEILDYYLHTNTSAMALLSDAEFPTLGNKDAPQSQRTRRNYAEALNVPGGPKGILRDADFPALGQHRSS